MSISVNTNSSSMTTVRSLNKSDRDLQQVESRMNTGLKVNSAKDNGAIYAMAQTLRADISGLGAVRNSLDIAVAVGDVALTGALGIHRDAELLHNPNRFFIHCVLMRELGE